MISAHHYRLPPRIRMAWQRLRGWAGIAAGIAAFLGLLKLGVQLYIQWRPRITPPAAAFLLDSRIRRRYRGPEATLAPLRLANGLRVLEAGSGTGAFTRDLAVRVGPEGDVHAVELQSHMLSRHRRRLKRGPTTRIALYQADTHDLPFAAHVFDRAVLIALLPMLAHKRKALEELRRVLKHGGLLMVSEELPEPEYVPPFVVHRWCRGAGFEEVARYHERWFYTLIFRNPA